MKTTRYILLALLLLAVAPLAASAQISIGAGIHIGPSGRASVDLGFFYDNLASYGNWIQSPSYGWVWTPRQVAASWRPYQDGHWVWTDQGWMWMSDEPYGWATYHYGRWYMDPELGWAWVPGDQWGPAWVSWQEGDDYVGWAPLPPGADISMSYDSGYGGGYYGGLSPASYVFVPERYFLAPQIVSYAVPVQQVVNIFPRTRNYTHYRVSGGQVYNQGIPVDRVQQVIGRRVTRYRVANLDANTARQRTARIAGDQVQIFRPQVQRSSQVAPPASRPAARNSVVSATQFRRNHPERAQQVRQIQAATPPPSGQRQNRQQQPAVQGQTQPNGRQPSATRGMTWDQIQAQRRQQRQNANPQVQNQQDQGNQNRRRSNNNNDNGQANRSQQPPKAQEQQDRRQQRQRQQEQHQPPQRQQYQPPQRQQPPQAQPQHPAPPPQSQGNHRGENRGPKNDKNQRDKNQRDRDRNQDQGPPPPQVR